jgi:hypothetical protein
MQATVQIEQPYKDGGRIVGTGFLLSAATTDGAPGTLLVTANHVLADMPQSEAQIGYRTHDPGGGWRYTPAPLTIRTPDGAPRWTRHPSQDVAVMRIVAPPEYARAAIPANYLAGESDAESSLTPGEELFVLGLPRGLAANNAGFPILRSGRVASYPVSPKTSPTFLLDFSVFPGNSGGPVFLTRDLQRASTRASHPVIAGILTQQVQLNDERLEIGIVVHARYIAETIDLIEGVHLRPAPVSANAEPTPGAEPVVYHPQRRSPWSRSIDTLRHGLARFLRRITDQLIAWLEPPAASLSEPAKSGLA